MEENNIIKFLEDKGVEIVKQQSQLQKVFDFEGLKSISQFENVSKLIHTEQNCIICFDTPTYNSNYLAEELFKVLNDLVNNFTLLEFYSIFGSNSNILTFQEFEFIKFQMKEKLSKIKFMYCQDEVIHQNLFDSYFTIHKDNFGIDTNNFLIPTIVFIDTNKQDIFIEFETVSPLSKLNILKSIFLSTLNVINYESNKRFRS